jgi:hypothetical protein
MASFRNIQYDTDYSQASSLFHLLYDHHLHLPDIFTNIGLKYASLFTYIQCFHDLEECRQLIDNSRQKMITLFISSNTLIHWHNNINDTDNNITNVFIFCDTFLSFTKMTEWDGCYHRKVRGVIMHDKLEYRLLYVGLDHIYTICEDFREDDGVRQKFIADGKQILRALGNYFGQRATKLSVEAT